MLIFCYYNSKTYIIILIYHALTGSKTPTSKFSGSKEVRRRSTPPLIKVSLYIYVPEELYRVSYKKLLRIIETVLYCFLLQIILCYFNRHISKHDVCKGRLLGNEISLFL